MSQPYLDARALLAMGMPRHVVDALQTTYDRTGGGSEVTINLPDLDALIATALGQGREARQLRERVNSLEQQLATIPNYTARLNQLSGQIEQLSLAILAQPTQSLSDLTRRIEQLEAVTA